MENSNFNVKKDEFITVINQGEKEYTKNQKYWNRVLVSKMGLEAKKLSKDVEENKKLAILVYGLMIFEFDNSIKKPVSVHEVNNIVGDITQDYYDDEMILDAVELKN